jgi:hypothetical protein
MVERASLVGATVAVHTLYLSPVRHPGRVYRVSQLVSEMAALTAAEIDQIVAAWPSDDEGLPASISAAFRGWKAQTLSVINPALQRLNDDVAVGYTTPAPEVQFRKVPKCRMLTANGVAPPLGVNPLVFELRAMLPSSGSSNVDPEVMRQLHEMAAQLKLAEGTIATLVRQTSQDLDEDVTTEYEIHPAVVDALPVSFVDLNPLSRSERLKIVRTHCGQYPVDRWPNPMKMSDTTRNCKEMQAAKKLTLPQYATELSKFMDRVSGATKLIGTAHSRILDLNAELREQVEVDPEVVFRGVDLLAKLADVETLLEGTMKVSLDTAAVMRLDVASRVDVAMAIDHLRIDPLKKVSDDFISKDTYKLVEEAAKQKQNLTWAKKGVFPGSQVGHFSGRPPPRSTGGGGYSSGGGGRGRGNGGGRGRGTDGGRGRSKGSGKGKGSGGKGKGKD